MNCDNCKWWGYGEFAYESPFTNVTAKTCGKIRMANWRHDDGNYDPELPIEYIFDKDENGYTIIEKQMLHHKAYCVDGSSYRAELVTAPDFGCVLWEKTE